MHLWTARLTASIDRASRSRASLLLRRCIGWFPLTPAGLLLLALSAFLYSNLWKEHRDYIAYLAACVGASVVGAVTLLVLLACAVAWMRVRRCRTSSPQELETDRWQATGFEFRFPAWIPCVQVEWTWEDPDGGPAQMDVRLRREWGRALEEVRPRRRGQHDRTRRRMTICDVVGLCAVSWTVDESVQLRILPARGNLDQMTLLSSLFASDEISDPRGEPFGDRVDMRQYTSGDSPRTILWKIYARSRKLMVKVPERAVTARPRTAAYFLAGPGDEPCAGLARVILERRLLGDGWRFGADHSFEAATTVPHALEILARSGAGRPADPGVLDAFLARAERDGYSCCVLFAPPRLTPSMDAARLALSHSRMRVHVMIGFDPQTVTTGNGSRWRRLLLHSSREGDVPVSTLEEAADFWRSAGADTFLTDRRAGRTYTDTHLLPRIAR